MSPSDPTSVRLRPEIVALPAYRQGQAAAASAFKLSSNENPFDPLPGVIAAVNAETAYNRYPDASALALRERLATRFGLSVDEVHIGAGSVALLAQLILAAAGPGDEVLYSWRSFEAYPGLVTVAGATSVQVPNRPDHGHDLPEMATRITPQTRVVIICSPNNPTGTIVTADEFESFMAVVPSDLLVILDEAYCEFVTDPEAVNGLPLLGRFPNLVVLRTFSKAYGLAGLRVGYAIGPVAVLNAARSTAIPLSVTGVASAAALASLDAADQLLRRVRALTERRDRVRRLLGEQGWNIPAPQGNFIWLPTGEETTDIADVLSAVGLIVRPFPEGIRISIGEEESVDKLLGICADIVDDLPTGHLARKLG
ncbi:MULTISPECIES: histidinol-phosphate transaminase [Cryobacterium]|uniref:Aromatic amino acid aminotransferase n=1 Tax=Cryobacterium breve TaxID=1259258 RepID=A0ABY2IU21_9MICO|nr:MULTISPECIES: histidinol-phosphate transaminase [Cryobacterium]TFC94852.1 aminotransferase class I/II-fold pyridoxal phosphate-dependent enzyme [Cryobacterium breve]TFC94982.1 aminotransferase class I/II-fold pyridoxal phosphate-dependent enzyme [Cryobacterium sp. TmT3-12]